MDVIQFHPMINSFQWRWFYKCPPLLISASAKPNWQGFYRPTRKRGYVPDLEVGRQRFVMHTDFDFDNPKTDFERAGAGQFPFSLVEVKETHAIVFATPQKVGWIESLPGLVVDELGFGDADTRPEITSLLEQLESEIKNNVPLHQLEWDCPDETAFLMNSARHGADPDAWDYQEISLNPGKYCVHYHLFEKQNASVYHFLKA